MTSLLLASMENGHSSNVYGPIDAAAEKGNWKLMLTSTPRITFTEVLSNILPQIKAPNWLNCYSAIELISILIDALVEAAH